MWTQCVNDLSRLAKETDAAASGRLAAEKQAYMSLPRPGVSYWWMPFRSDSVPSPASTMSLSPSSEMSINSFPKFEKSLMERSEGSDSPRIILRQSGDRTELNSGHFCSSVHPSDGYVSANHSTRAENLDYRLSELLDDLSTEVNKNASK